jgi:hypothetical protein
VATEGNALQALLKKINSLYSTGAIEDLSFIKGNLMAYRVAVRSATTRVLLIVLSLALTLLVCQDHRRFSLQSKSYEIYLITLYTILTKRNEEQTS